MPSLERAQGIPIGQIGQVSRVSPRADDNGLGGILQKAANAEFAAGQQTVATGSEMAGLGAAQTAAGLELMKPFARMRASREALMAGDIAITAQQSLRSTADTLTSSGASPDTWGQTFNNEFTKTQNSALLAAQKISPAAMEHVYKELRAEQLNLFTDVRKKALGRDKDDQLGALERKEEFILKEATAQRDPDKRLASKQTYLADLDRASFNGIITPTVAEQKRVSFEKRLLRSTTIQHAIENGLPATLVMIDNLVGVDDVDKASLRDVAEHEVRFKVKETEDLTKAAEKRLKVEQGATLSIARNQVAAETNPTNLLALRHKIPDYQLNGVLSVEGGDQLIGHIDRRMEDLIKPNPEEDVASIVNDITYKIVTNPGSVPDNYIFNVRGLSTATRARLESLQNDRKSQGAYKNIPEYSNSIELFKSLDNTKVNVFAFPVLDTNTAAPPGLGEYIRRAIIAYDDAIETEAKRVGHRLNGAEIRQFDDLRERLITRIKTVPYMAAGGKSIDEILK